jgi:hypothetical protein
VKAGGNQFKSAAEAQKWFSSRLNNSDDAIGAQKPILEPGVGDAAYSKLGVLASTKAAEWVGSAAREESKFL